MALLELGRISDEAGFETHHTTLFSIAGIEDRKFSEVNQYSAASTEVTELEEQYLEMGSGSGGMHAEEFGLSLPTKDSIAKHPEAQDEPAELPTLDSTATERRKRSISSLAPDGEQSPIAENEASIIQDIEEAQHNASPQTAQEYEDEAGQQGAFNPETGEINWDCPCLGGMAHGPCGEEFKKAFSCFVYSKEEPKGMDCIEHFKTMQGCFREHPDIYGGELDEEEEGDAQALDADAQRGEPGNVSTLPPLSSQPQASSPQISQPSDIPPATTHLQATPTNFSVSSNEKRSPSNDDAEKERVSSASKQVKEEHPPLDESDELVPKAAHDARSKNEGK
ncbi:MAG: Oxidoreductase [Candelina submexicana]|nr:MAG: Oxidoreductase [Candelina submexicana]